jgi:hypothetical protein
LHNNATYREFLKPSEFHDILVSLVFVLILFPAFTRGQQSSGILHVYPIGNLADFESGSPEIEALARQIKIDKIPSVLLFTGDITKSDLTDPRERARDSTRVVSILQTLQSEYTEHSIFIPGDRDWDYSGKKGWANVTILENIIESLPVNGLKWTPGKGCPGPKEVEVGENLVVVVLNTQYWNHPYNKPAPVDALCKISSRADFLEELEDIISETRNRNLLIAGHFPMISSGEYSGRMSLKKHVFPFTDLDPNLWIPLPVVGSFYPAWRQNIGSPMDIVNEHYEEFNRSLKIIARDHPGLICISGHDEVRELAYLNNSYILNSGALKWTGYTGKLDGRLFVGRDKGLVRLEYHDNGNVSATAFSFKGETLVKQRSLDLYQSACLLEPTDLPVNEYYAPCMQEMIFAQKMSRPWDLPVTVVAGQEYAASGMKKLFFGRHYRESWTTPVRTRYLDLDTTFGGLVPIKRGGGRQTTSLKFRAGNGCQYVFRSVNKDPKKALSYELRETIVADIVKDQTSTQQPYGAMATRLMLEELNILHPSPTLYVLPPDDKLGPFRKSYANLFGMLEESPKSPNNLCHGFGGSDEVIRSYKLFRNLFKDHNRRVNQEEFAKTRVFDILIGDWGRHEDNWKWAGYNKNDVTLYRPIPRDRDHAFSVWDGLLPWIADREWAKPSGEHFGYGIKDVRSLTWSARHLDRVLLTQVDRIAWMEQAELVKDKMTDELIERSIRNMPEEVYAVSGKEIIARLKARRNNLEAYILEYYHLLAKQVDVLGSAEAEAFTVDRRMDNTVFVTVTPASGTDTLYARTFFPDETKEIRLYGLGNEDTFTVRGESRKSILVRIIGGKEADRVQDFSSVKGPGKMTLIYEKDNGSVVDPGTEGRQVHSRNEKLYDYDRHAFAYNTYFPLPYVGYNADDGLVLGLGITFKRQRFGKEGFSARHSIDLKGSTAGNLQFAYEGQLHHAIGKWDIVYHGMAAYPSDFVYFYGYGNETDRSDSLFKKDFYKTRYNSIRLGAGVLREFMRRSRFSITVNYENNDGQIPEHTILDVPTDILGKGKINLLEGRAMLDLDFRNDKKFPERGMRFFGEYVQGLITNNDNSSYNKATGFIEFHATVPLKLPLFLGLKGGGAISSGDIPFYKLLSIGQNNYLRGYRKNRFAGKSMAFFNSDLKLQVLDIITPIVPVKFGIRGFYDLGKVYVDEETSQTLHMGYGGGIYLIPLEKAYSLSLNMAFSEDEKSGLLVFEFGITF